MQIRAISLLYVRIFLKKTKLPNLNEILNEFNKHNVNPEQILLKYLKKLYSITSKNTILYYSGWLEKSEIGMQSTINDNDMHSLMTVINGLDTKKGLDLILHTPGGDTGATIAIANYLHSMFGNNIRAIVPQLALSAGTMLSLSCNSIVMGKHSSLGPIDPQINGRSANTIIAEFEKAQSDIIQKPEIIPLWQAILSNCPVGNITLCKDVIKLSKDTTKKWLQENMFKDKSDSDKTIEIIINCLTDHEKTLSHSRHIPISECEEMGLKIERMENNQEFQDTILSIYHAARITSSTSPIIKIITNQNGVMVKNEST